MGLTSFRHSHSSRSSRSCDSCECKPDCDNGTDDPWPNGKSLSYKDRADIYLALTTSPLCTTKTVKSKKLPFILAFTVAFVICIIIII